MLALCQILLQQKSPEQIPDFSFEFIAWFLDAKQYSQAFIYAREAHEGHRQQTC